MSSVDFSKPGFVWEYRNALLPAIVTVVPLAIEAGLFLKTVYSNPDQFKQKCSDLKNRICDAFQKRSTETSSDYKKRLLKNIFITVVALSALAAAAVCPFLMLPSAFAIPAAIGLVQTVGKCLISASKIPNLISRVKNYLVDSFHQRSDESLESFQRRRLQAIKKIVLYSVLFAAAIAAVCCASYFASAASHVTSVWSIPDLLPNQTPVVATLEYLAVGTAHAVQAIRAWRANDKSKAAMHMTAALFSILFPLGYLLQDPSKMRLHHSFTGLLLMLAPWRPVQILGGAIALDSSLYFIYSQHGVGQTHVTTSPWGSQRIVTDQYDFMNTIFDNLPFVLTSLTALCFVQSCLNYFKKKPNEKKIDQPVKGIPIEPPLVVESKFYKIKEDQQKIAAKLTEMAALKENFIKQKVQWMEVQRAGIASVIQEATNKKEVALKDWRKSMAEYLLLKNALEIPR